MNVEFERESSQQRAFEALYYTSWHYNKTIGMSHFTENYVYYNSIEYFITLERSGSFHMYYYELSWGGIGVLVLLWLDLEKILCCVCRSFPSYILLLCAMPCTSYNSTLSVSLKWQWIRLWWWLMTTVNGYRMSWSELKPFHFSSCIPEPESCPVQCAVSVQ